MLHQSGNCPPPSPFWPALTLPHRQLTQHDQERIWQQQQRRLQKAALWTILKIVLDSCRGRISATASDCEMHGGCVFWVECTHTHIFHFAVTAAAPAVSCDVWLRRGSTFTSILRGVTFCVQARYTKAVCVLVYKCVCLLWGVKVRNLETFKLGSEREQIAFPTSCICIFVVVVVVPRW